MKIAIVFGDNDFINTFSPLMNTLFKAYKHCDKLPNNKEELLIVINSLSYGFYLSFQEGHFSEHIKNYLIIGQNKLLLNEEVDEYLKLLEPYGGGDNSSTFILDTTLYNNNVYIV